VIQGSNKDWIHGQALWEKSTGLERTARQIRDIQSLVLEKLFPGVDVSDLPEMTESDVNDIICYFGFSAGGHTAKHNNGTKKGRSARGTNAAASRRRKDARLPAAEQAKKKKGRYDAAVAREAAKRLNRLNRGDELLPRGVTYKKKSRRYQAQISWGGTQRYIGKFATSEEAAAAVESVEKDLDGVDPWSLSEGARNKRFAKAKKKAGL